MMDQDIHDKIVSFIRAIEATLGSRLHFAAGCRTLSADAKKE